MDHRSLKYTGNTCLTFWQLSRLVFTLFSLYLMGDVIYRWGGFEFHSSFSEYLPNVALAILIWSIVAYLSSIAIWVFICLQQKVFETVNRYLRTEHLALYLSVFILMGALAWIGKRLIWPNIATLLQLKLIVIIACISLPLSCLFRSKAFLWINVIQERITPLVWLFAVCAMVSLLVVGFHMWGKNTSKKMPLISIKSRASESYKKRPNILLITFDALTARNMSIYGYSKNTTPFMKKWANTASLFTRAKAESSYTSATIASLMTGKRVWTHRKYQHDLNANPFKSKTENLILVMKENGYYTYALIQNINASVEAAGISSSLDIAPPVVKFMRPGSIGGIIEKHLFMLFGDTFKTYNWLGQEDFIFTILLRKIHRPVLSVTEYPPENVFNKFLETIDNNRSEPFFAWLHLHPPHDPYLPPNPHIGTFNPSKELRTQYVQWKLLKSTHTPPEEKTVNSIRARYDEFIRYCDKQFENFIVKLRNKNILNNTIIILSSDHGESFDHGNFTHGGPNNLYESVTHIPLITKKPDQKDGQIIHDLVEQIDIPATILDLAHIEIPPWMEGRSLAPLLRGKELQPRPIFSMMLIKNKTKHSITKGMIAVWDGNYKLIHNLDLGKEESQLYNLSNDSGELNNLFDKETEVGQRLLSLIQENLIKANKKIRNGE